MTSGRKRAAWYLQDPRPIQLPSSPSMPRQSLAQEGQRTSDKLLDRCEDRCPDHPRGPAAYPRARYTSGVGTVNYCRAGAGQHPPAVVSEARP